MAQTKRKRPSKHRGNAAGMIEARGRTGRKPNEAEKRAGTGTGPGGKGKKTQAPKPDRYATPPTWRGALNRALFAAALVLGSAIILLGFKPVPVLAFLPVVLGVYVPLGYYTDLFIYRRRQRQKAG